MTRSCKKTNLEFQESHESPPPCLLNQSSRPGLTLSLFSHQLNWIFMHRSLWCFAQCSSNLNSLTVLEKQIDCMCSLYIQVQHKDQIYSICTFKNSVWLCAYLDQDSFFYPTRRNLQHNSRKNMQRKKWNENRKYIFFKIDPFVHLPFFWISISRIKPEEYTEMSSDPVDF